MSLYDEVDEEVLKSYTEFSLSAMIFGAMKEAAASEQSSRMTAMDSASKNAGASLLSNRDCQEMFSPNLCVCVRACMHACMCEGSSVIVCM